MASLRSSRNLTRVLSSTVWVCGDAPAHAAEQTQDLPDRGLRARQTHPGHRTRDAMQAVQEARPGTRCRSPAGSRISRTRAPPLSEKRWRPGGRERESEQQTTHPRAGLAPREPPLTQARDCPALRQVRCVQLGCVCEPAPARSLHDKGSVQRPLPDGAASVRRSRGKDAAPHSEQKAEAKAEARKRNKREQNMALARLLSGKKPEPKQNDRPAGAGGGGFQQGL